MAVAPEFTNQILSYIGCVREEPSVRYVNRLIRAYIRRLPWGSVLRIVKRHPAVDVLVGVF